MPAKHVEHVDYDATQRRAVLKLKSGGQLVLTNVTLEQVQRYVRDAEANAARSETSPEFFTR